MVSHVLRRAAQSACRLSGVGSVTVGGRRVHLQDLHVAGVFFNDSPFAADPSSSFVLDTGIAILQTLSYRLYDPDPAALRSVLAGTAPVVLPTARAGASATEVKVEEGLWRAGGGRIYGIEEGRFFGFLREGEREWKEGAFGRLVQRELDSAM